MGAYAADSSKYDWCRHYPAPRQSGPGGRNFHLFLDYNKLLCYLSGLCICQVWYVQQETGWYGGGMRNIPLGRLEISCAAIPIRYRFWYRMWPLRFRLWAMELRALIFHWVRFPPVSILSGLSGLPRYPISEGQALPGVLVELPSLGC